MISQTTVAPTNPTIEAAPPSISSERRKLDADLLPPTATNRRGNGWLWFFVLAALGAAGWHYWPEISPRIAPYLPKTDAPKPKTGARIIPVVTATVVQRDMNLYLNGLGTITALKTVTIRSRVEGALTNVAFTEGQMVNEGDLLVEIDPRTFEVLHNQADAQLRRDEATLRAAELNLSRYTQLLATKITTQQQIDDQLALVDQYQAMLKADRAMIANADLQLTYCRIAAPISGRIGLRMVDEGNIVHPNDANGLAVITQLQPIALVFTIPQDDVARVQRAMQSGQNLAVEAFDRDFKTKLASGRLKAIDNQVDPTNGTVRLKAEFPNEDSLLFPNQFVNARLLVETRHDVTVVPSAAVQRGPNGTFVYLVESDDTVDVRNITVGPTEGSDQAVESGLQPGDRVVTEGLDKLSRKAKVSTRDSKPGDKEGGAGAGKKKGAADGSSQKNKT